MAPRALRGWLRSAGARSRVGFDGDTLQAGNP